MEVYKYQGAGNDFIIADNRDKHITLDTAQIAALCDRRYGIGADGLMLLETAPGYDFKMVYYNSDGSGGMMCGNGGRCIVAFADLCGISKFDFIAADGPHHAEILRRDGLTATVKLQMKDVDGITRYVQPQIAGSFLDTGTRHLVCPVNGLESYDVVGVGRKKRYMPEFGPIGVNVNFIERKGNTLHVRTYEKGVEDETYACGTGITASAIAAWHYEHGQEAVPEGTSVQNHDFETSVVQSIRALRDDLAVEFTPTPTGAVDVYLIGPATYVAKIILPS